MLVLTFLLIILVPLVASQKDGNPHGWDRKRRCDDEDYDPPCDLCEGYGGVAWSDRGSDIKLTTCTPIGRPEEVDKSTISEPFLPDVFTNEGFYEVLIGMKTNPLCIGAFPGPDSLGDHCYTPQQGTFHYDWNNYQLRIDYNVKGYLANSTLITYHNKGDMWIISDYSIFKQCICIDPGRRYNITIYPVNPKFLKEGSRYIGREKLGIEYLWQERIVDHWVKGPHHVWVDVATGKIIRMWQPWNGLEVFDPEKWVLSADPNVFITPPELCKKKGFFSSFRVGCDDDGNYIRKK
jgi:hypothetical protein